MSRRRRNGEPYQAASGRASAAARRERLGEEGFRAAMKALRTRGGGRPPFREQVRRALEREAAMEAYARGRGPKPT